MWPHYLQDAGPAVSLCYHGDDATVTWLWHGSFTEMLTEFYTPGLYLAVSRLTSNCLLCVQCQMLLFDSTTCNISRLLWILACLSCRSEFALKKKKKGKLDKHVVGILFFFSFPEINSVFNRCLWGLALNRIFTGCWQWLRQIPVFSCW